ncbi:MAG: hypothetical protein Q9220_002284 [cf. Caloplaca sp. 1 TL-2023]
MAISEDPTQRDPWDWTLDEVVVALCDPSGIFRLNKNPQSLPDAVVLEQKLREHYIEGCSLLTDIDHASLKEDLGIQALGQRGHILREVYRLRTCSGKYTEHCRHLAPESSFGFASNIGTIRQITPIPQWHLASLQNPTPAPLITPFHSPLNATGYLGPPSTFRPSTPVADRSDLQTSLSASRQWLDQLPDIPPPFLTTGGTENAIDEPTNQQYETSIIDEQGRKRRRLVLDNSTLVAVENSPGTTTPRTLNGELQPGRKRIAPTLVSSPQISYETSAPELAHVVHTKEALQGYGEAEILHLRTPSQCYLGMKALLVDDIFYDQSLPGHQPITSSLPRVSSAGYNSESSDDLKFIGSPVSNGQRYYIASRIKHFLQQDTAIFQSGSQYRYGIRPYPNRLGRKHRPLSLTIFENAGNEVLVSRRDRSLWTQSLVQDSPKVHSDPILFQDDVEQDWDYLRKWDRADLGSGTVLPLYGESGSEGEYDLDIWREMEREKGGKLPRPLRLSKGSRRLSGKEVSDVIEAAVQQMVIDWKQKMLAKLDGKAWILWSKSRRNGTKQLKISSLEYDLQHLGVRLKKLTQEISHEQWTSAPRLHRQCESLRRTIYEREESQWMANMLQSKQRPEKPLNIDRTQQERKTKPKLPHETVDNDPESDGDATSVGDDLDGFVVDDEDGSSSVDEELPVVDTSDVDKESSRMDISSDETSAQQVPNHSLDDLRPNQRSPIPIERSINSAPVEPPSADVIDLTMDSDSSESKPAPPLRHPLRPLVVNTFGTPVPIDDETKEDANERHQRKAALFKSPPNLEKSKDVVSVSSSLPALSDIKEIGEMSPTLLMQRHDRKRFLIYVLTKCDIQKRKDGYLYIKNKLLENVQKGVWNTLKSLTGYRSRVAGIESEKESETLKQITAWFIMWTHIIIVSPLTGVNHEQISEAAADRAGFEPFFTFLLEIRCLSDYDPNSATILTPSKKKRLLIDYEEENDDSPAKSTKKRKYAVPESQEAADLRKKAQQRVIDREKRQRKLNKTLQKMGKAEEDAAQVIVNMGKLDDQELIYLRPSIGERIQPHQKEGLRFLWREIVEDHASQQGCLLAQAMGLGKTMQVISFLVTIAAAAKSPNQDICSQIPPRLRQCQTLVLCPPSLVENWYEEFLLWAQPIEETVRDVRYITSAMQPHDRLQAILDWEKEGGVLVLGYSILKDLIGTPKNKEAAEDDASLREVKDILLKRPNIVVADEAHTAKNPNSKINKVLNRFETRSRIALTGSPLSNNLSEYYVLIEWIAPGYLGEHREFVYKYEEPIQKGLYSDSTERQWRLGLKKLELFKREVQPKVHRADIAVLASRLQGKSEFVIKVNRTQLQEKLYQAFVGSMNERFRGTEGPHLTTLWSWIAILRLVCNHPKCYYDKLKEKGRHTKRRKENKVYGPHNDKELVDEMPQISDEFTRRQLQIFEELPGPIEAVALSYKMKLLLQILELCRAVGDLVLVFSHSLTTLDYIQYILESERRAFYRMDGSMRTDLRQSVTKDFNRGLTDILLISTRAGGTGLNLFGANRVVIVDDHFNPAWEEQAVGRAYRIGQTKHVYVYRLTVGGTFEEALHNQSLFKQQLATRAVDRKNIARLAHSTREYMKPLETLEQTNLESMKGKDPHVLDMILADQACDSFIRDIVPCETFQQEVDEELTAEERREVEEEEADSRLRRTDPEAYQAKIMSRSAHSMYIPSLQPIPPNCGMPSSKDVTKSPNGPGAAGGLSNTNPGRSDINGPLAQGSPVRVWAKGIGPEALPERSSISKTAATFGKLLDPPGNNTAKEDLCQSNDTPRLILPHRMSGQEPLLPILGANTTLRTTTSMPPEQQSAEVCMIQRAGSEPGATAEGGLVASSASASTGPALSARYPSLQNLMEREEERARRKEAMAQACLAK